MAQSFSGGFGLGVEEQINFAPRFLHGSQASTSLPSTTHTMTSPGAELTINSHEYDRHAAKKESKKARKRQRKAEKRARKLAREQALAAQNPFQTS